MTSTDGDAELETPASIIIPAHNESAGIRRLLAGVLGEAGPSEFEVIVVCNGCTDDTADQARRFGPGVQVIETPVPSKRAALARGDAQARHAIRLYVDADVELGTRSVRALVRAVREPGILAAAPTRVLPLGASSGLVRSYYRVWERLPQVQSGLFGRGVIAMSEEGHRRIQALPPVMSDDLALSEAFSASERAIVETARVVVHPPRTAAALVRRRIRVSTGNAQIDELHGRSDASKTSITTLIQMARREPRLAPGVLVFLSLAVAARVGAWNRVRRGDFDTWLRDDSSRS